MCFGLHLQARNGTLNLRVVPCRFEALVCWGQAYLVIFLRSPFVSFSIVSDIITGQSVCDNLDLGSHLRSLPH